jgi:hypothetical protein
MTKQIIFNVHADEQIPDQLEKVTVEAYRVARLAGTYTTDYRSALYSQATHHTCKCGAVIPEERGHQCDACQREQNVADLKKMKTVQSNGEPIIYTETLFFDLDDVVDKLIEDFAKDVYGYAPPHPQEGVDYESSVKRWFNDNPLPVYTAKKARAKISALDAIEDFNDCAEFEIVHDEKIVEELVNLETKINKLLDEHYYVYEEGDERIDPKELAKSYLKRIDEI